VYGILRRHKKIGQHGGAYTSELIAEAPWLRLQFNHRDRLRAFAIPYGVNPSDYLLRPVAYPRSMSSMAMLQQ
jgi:hypothetical protein